MSEVYYRILKHYKYPSTPSSYPFKDIQHI